MKPNQETESAKRVRLQLAEGLAKWYAEIRAALKSVRP